MPIMPEREPVMRYRLSNVITSDVITCDGGESHNTTGSTKPASILTKEEE